MEALHEMRAVAVLEDNTDKSAVTPGPLAPARELLGEMLLELKQPAEARSEPTKSRRSRSWVESGPTTHGSIRRRLLP